jgi:hypothetical protein
MGAFFATRLSHYAGQPVDIASAPADVVVAALRDQFLFVAALVGFGLALSLWAWRRERTLAIAQVTVPLQPDR